MFHSHALHAQAESILRGTGGQLGEGFTFRGFNPVCAIGRLAHEAGFVPVDFRRLHPSTAGEDVVRRVYGLTEAEVRQVMSVNDAAGPARLERLADTLRSFCPVCTRLDGMGERKVVEALREEA